MVESGGRVFSQFPPGFSILLAVGELVHLRWLVTPLCGAVAALLFARLAYAIENQETVAGGAAMIFALAPFFAFMAGSHMNHVPTLALLIGAFIAVDRLMQADTPNVRAAITVGLCFGAAGAIRPVDALAFAVPAAIWILARTIRAPQFGWNGLVAGIGVTIPLLPVLWVNARTTGDPFVFGYEALWGRSHRLGFHPTPWGPAHTPARGVSLIRAYFLRLQSYLFETPVPSLLPIGVALGLSRRVSAFDRYLLSGSGCLVALYFAYWHDGFYLGPRFMLPLMPVFALWTARSLALVTDRFGRGGLVHRIALYTAIVAGVLAVLTEIPLRLRQYHGGLLTMRWNADSAASRGNVRNALVLVRESWGSERIARMWSLGLTRPEAEHVFTYSDACSAQHAIDSLEHEGVSGRPAYQALSRLLVDSALIVKTELPSGSKEPILPGTRYSSRCLARIHDDVNGFTVHLPLMLARSGGNIYARDLHGRDTLLLKDYPGRPIWILRPKSSRLGAEPYLTMAPTDSLYKAWHFYP
ncbi:MAG: hypothetical protein NVS1B4_02230 [Gemmatimonadaceae bacterium]